MEHLYKIALVLLIGCGTEETTPDIPDDPAFPRPPDGEGLQLVSAIHVEPGQELHTCRYLVLPDRELEVARLQHHYTAGSHHMLLYPTSKRADEIDSVPFDCLAAGDLGATGVLYGSSVADGELPYPDGIAIKLAARSVVLLETHYLNPADTALEAEARINLWFTTTPASIEAGTLFFRDWAIYLPPTGATETTATMRCEIPADISLLYATSHMHRRGTSFVSTVDGSPLHTSESWDSPTPTVYWPPREIAAGSTIELTCGYRNTDGRHIVEGPSAETDEMCVLVGGYWPKLPAASELCLTDGSGPVLAGTQTCEQTVDCMVDAGVGNWVGGQQCVARTCESSASALSSFVVCVNANNCWGDPSCVVAKCPAQWNSCTQAGC